MAAQKNLWESIADGVRKTVEQVLSGPAGDFLGIDPKVFAEIVAANVIAALIVSAIVFVVGVLASQTLWQAMHIRFRAATIRRAAGRGFVLVLCPIENDSNDAIGGEIAARIEEAFLAFSSLKGSRRAFEVLKFPLPLAGDDGTVAFDRSLRRAKHWLDRTNGDVLIWGQHVKKGSVGVVRLIGTDRRSGLIDTRRIDFDKNAKQFDQALANAIAVEMASLKSIVFQDPKKVPLDLLRSLIKKFNRLAAHEAPALNEDWRARMACERDRMKVELLRRTADTDEQADLEGKARARLATLASHFE